MGAIQQLADVWANTNISDGDWLWISALGATAIMWIFLVGLAAYIINSIFLMKLFEKANVDAWRAWVPIYNSIKFLQLGGYHGAYILVALIPFVGSLILLVFNCIAAYNIGRKLGKDSAGWVILYILLSIVWYGINGLDKSTWSEKLGTKPSVAPEKSPGQSTEQPSAPAA
jgi:hypothetical protein